MGTDQPLPHETLPRSGRATRWTNTPVRIFKDQPPTPTSRSVPPTPTLRHRQRCAGRFGPTFAKGSVESTLRKGQLNRHTRYRPARLPHETLPRSGRATRWTNTPVRIFKDPAPTFRHPHSSHTTSISPMPIVCITGLPVPPSNYESTTCPPCPVPGVTSDMFSRCST